LAERGDKMKKSLKYSLLIMLTLLIITSLVNAQPVPIGTAEQDRPYESNPIVATPTNIVATFGNERDGSLATSVSFQGVPAAGSGLLVMSGFKVPPPAQQFPIGWVDLKIKYKHPGIGDDGYNMMYRTSGLGWTWLQTTVSGAAATFDLNGNPAVRPWPNLPTYPNTGAWTWTDVTNLNVRILVTKGAPTPGWESFFDLYEVWLTIYEHAPPTSTPPDMSLMPGASNISITSLEAGKYFFVDVYANGLTSPPGLWGYQATIKYDESIVTALSWFTYWPFVTPGTPGGGWVNIGNVSVLYGTFAGDLVGFGGTATPLCRIYFQVDKGGATPLDLIDDRLLAYPLITELKPAGQPSYVPTLHDSWFSSPLYLSAQAGLIDLTTPLTTIWHEDYPGWSKLWHLTSWEDVSPYNPGVLGPSDQINMTDETGWSYWFHVENVTITIHWTFKEGEGGPLTEEIGVAEPEVPMLAMPLGSPVGSMWHMIYPTYCQWITIASWVDTNLDDEFSASDQFDFTLGAGDVVLAGPTPAAGSPLSWPASPSWAQVLYWDADSNGVWDVGEPAIDDTDWDGWYTQFVDTVLIGPDPGPTYLQLSNPGAMDMFHDANGDTTWTVGEPAIRDTNLNGIFDPPVTFWAHLDNVSTDIIVCQKPIEPVNTGPWPEFPLGITLLLLIAPIVPLTYLWRLRRKVTKQ